MKDKGDMTKVRNAIRRILESMEPKMTKEQVAAFQAAWDRQATNGIWKMPVILNPDDDAPAIDVLDLTKEDA